MTFDAGLSVNRPEIRVVAGPSGIDVHLSGDLDDDAGELLANAIVAAADSIGPSQRVDVDLREVRQLTSRGLHVLASCTSNAKVRRRIRVRFGRPTSPEPQAFRIGAP